MARRAPAALEAPMRKQRNLPGIPDRTTSADIKALVQSRLLGFELRQEERARRRAEKGLEGGEEPGEAPVQGSLFPSAAEPSGK
jgi:hypothetical protein